MFIFFRGSDVSQSRGRKIKNSEGNFNITADEKDHVSETSSISRPISRQSNQEIRPNEQMTVAKKKFKKKKKKLLLSKVSL